MKKVAIYTLQEYNYGNRLQNYAVQQTLENLGYQVVSLNLLSPSERNEKIFQRYHFLEKIKAFMPLISKMEMLYRAYLKRDRIGNFKRFNQIIHFADDNEYISKEKCNISLEKYYAIVVGSDQVWNTNFPTCTLNSFLPFKHDRKIAFSASFGVDSIPNDEKIADCLKQFRAISVREDTGKKIVMDLSNKDATVLIDPTLMIDAVDWRKLSRRPKNVKEGYILTYFLSPKCTEADSMLKISYHGRKIYELLNSEESIDGIGPAEFLWMFDHADLILTDSYHASIFSFLFNKPFVVFDRNWEGGNMNSRLDTFLSRFDIERKHYSPVSDINIWEHNYEKGYAVLEKERGKVTHFLQENL